MELKPSAPSFDCGAEKMPHVHSLVKSPSIDEKGWCAPVELGDAAPHYVSFVVPVDERGQFFDAYSCEAVTTRNKGKTISTHEFFSKGNDTFLLKLNDKEFWFIVKPTVKSARRLPYVGRLKHPDFQFLFTEIEPEEPAALDELCDKDHTFVMGCDPFTHYAGIKQSA
jgi:hypothetical protein